MNRNRILNHSIEPAWMDAALAIGQRPGDGDQRALLEATLSDMGLPKWARVKVREIVGPVWLDPPNETAAFIHWARDNVDPTGDLRAIHLLALMATYPFFGDVCTAVGRLLRLQGDVTTSDLRSRLRAKWGDREIVEVAQRMCIYTLRAFGALSAEPRASVSRPAEPLLLSRDLGMWAVHALVLARNAESIDIMEVDAAPEVFFTSLEAPRGNGYPLLERFSMAGGRAEFVLSQWIKPA
jgi:hypothetical protein